MRRTEGADCFEVAGFVEGEIFADGEREEFVPNGEEFWFVIGGSEKFGTQGFDGVGVAAFFFGLGELVFDEVFAGVPARHGGSEWEIERGVKMSERKSEYRNPKEM